MDYEKIRKELDSEYYIDREAAMEACIGEDDVPIDIIKKGLSDKYRSVRRAALKNCIGRTDIPIELIENLFNKGLWMDKIVVIEACMGRHDTSIDIIEKGLNDEDADVNLKAAKLCFEKCKFLQDEVNRLKADLGLFETK